MVSANNYNWHLLSVDSFELNQGNVPIYHGVASFDEPNVPISVVNDRYSMVFTQDILSDYTSTGDSAWIPGALVTTIIHELGHERAGLTDVWEYPNFHAMGVNCVMEYSISIDVNSPRFCNVMQENAHPNQVSHCLENIRSNYGTQ